MRNLTDATSTEARTLHNVPPSFWRHCRGCGHTVRAETVWQGRHATLSVNGKLWCGPVDQDTRTAGGTDALVKRMG